MSWLMANMVTTTLSMALFMIFWGMKENDSKKVEELISFECGFSNMSASKMNFSTNFIMVMMMFLIFDIEVTILITMTMSSKNSMTEKIMPTTFLILVTILMLKEWWQGALEWKK